ncbi:hypothetical protein RhiirA4_479527 [Rhizophagus irregularis]|uniref:Uncharacterized protein n=1 Tax=Rhizophagus irregularis TaxID=588596 RepID=A0A2I1HGJ7_9GLOM|nr:hypothetical protein RhiirA4_479527 [Rhizophagus irregularis]
MSTITLSCLVINKDPYENAFNIRINKTKVVSELRKTIKKKIDDIKSKGKRSQVMDELEEGIENKHIIINRKCSDNEKKIICLVDDEDLAGIENTKIKTEKAKLEVKDAKYLKQVMEDNVKLKTRIEELEKNNGVTTKLESENVKLKAKVAKLEENYKLMQNDNTTMITNSTNNSSSNF